MPAKHGFLPQVTSSGKKKHVQRAFAPAGRSHSLVHCSTAGARGGATLAQKARPLAHPISNRDVTPQGLCEEVRLEREKSVLKQGAVQHLYARLAGTLRPGACDAQLLARARPPPCSPQPAHRLSCMPSAQLEAAAQSPYSLHAAASMPPWLGTPLAAPMERLSKPTCLCAP